MRNCNCHSHDGFLLSPEGLAQRELSLDVEPEVHTRVLGTGKGSVSGLVSVEVSHVFDDDLIDQQYRRFTHGT